MSTSNNVNGSLDLLLLSVLEHGPAHGYAIIASLRDQSGGAFDLPEGTVYPALHKLEHEGEVTSTWDSSSGRRRRVYALTTCGDKSLAEERKAWFRFNDGVHAVLGYST